MQKNLHHSLLLFIALMGLCLSGCKPENWGYVFPRKVVKARRMYIADQKTECPRRSKLDSLLILPVITENSLLSTEASVMVEEMLDPNITTQHIMPLSPEGIQLSRRLYPQLVQFQDSVMTPALLYSICLAPAYPYLLIVYQKELQYLHIPQRQPNKIALKIELWDRRQKCKRAGVYAMESAPIKLQGKPDPDKTRNFYFPPLPHHKQEYLLKKILKKVIKRRMLKIK